MKTVLLVIAAFALQTLAEASPPCTTWAKSDFDADVNANWLFGLWQNGEKPDDFGNTYSKRVSGDITSPAVLDKISKNYDLDNPLNKTCKDTIMADKNFSPTNILNKYVRNLYAFRGCEAKFSARAAKDAKANFDAWIDPDDYLRLAFSNSLFEKSNGKILYVPTGTCATGAYCNDQALIKYESNGHEVSKKIDLRTPYFQSFCPNLSKLQSQLEDRKRKLAANEPDGANGGQDQETGQYSAQ